MTIKEDLILALVLNCDMRRDFAKKCVDTVLTTIRQSLQAKDPVLLQGIGKLDIVEKSAQRAFDMNKGEAIMLAPRTVIKFKPCRDMKTL